MPLTESPFCGKLQVCGGIVFFSSMSYFQSHNNIFLYLFNILDENLESVSVFESLAC